MMATRSFTHDLPISDLFALPGQKEGFARLKYIVSSKSFGVITGTPGTGKSSHPDVGRVFG